MTYWHAAYRDHAPAVLAYLKSRLRPEDAEDLLQETFTRAIRSSGSLRDESKLRPYLMTIAHNLMVNRFRRRTPALFSESATADGTAPYLEPVSGEPTPEQEANLAQLEERVHSALEEMPPKLRTAFEQAVLQQEAYKSIARRNGWSLAQVKINVYRARQRAISRLQEFLPIDAS